MVDTPSAGSTSSGPHHSTPNPPQGGVRNAQSFTGRDDYRDSAYRAVRPIVRSGLFGC